MEQLTIYDHTCVDNIDEVEFYGESDGVDLSCTVLRCGKCYRDILSSELKN